MRKCLVGIALAMVLSALAVQGQTSSLEWKKISQEYDSTLGVFAKDKWPAIRQALSDSPKEATVRAVLSLASDSKEKMADRAIPFKERTLAADVNLDSWRLLLVIHRCSTDTTSKELIYSEWNNALKDESIVIEQVLALSMEFDRAFLSHQVWHLFNNSKNPLIIQAICCVLAMKGDAEDMELLRRKFKASEDQTSKSLYSEAAISIEIRLNPDRPGPPGRVSVPWPTMEDIIKAEKQDNGA